MGGITAAPGDGTPARPTPAPALTFLRLIRAVEHVGRGQRGGHLPGVDHLGLPCKETSGADGMPARPPPAGARSPPAVPPAPRPPRALTGGAVVDGEEQAAADAHAVGVHEPHAQQGRDGGIHR